MPGIIERLFDQVSKEGHVIAQAKLVFGAAAALIACVTALVVWHIASTLFSERIAMLQTTIDYEKTQISDLQNRVQAVAPVPVPSRAQVLPLAMRFFDAEANRADHRPFVNFTVMNASTVPAKGELGKGLLRVFDHLLSAEEEDQNVLKVKEWANFPDPRKSSKEMLLGELLTISALNENEDADKEIQSIKDGTKYLYAFFVIQFVDDSLPQNEKYVMERCAVFYKIMDSVGLCNGHDQVYIEKIK